MTWIGFILFGAMCYTVGMIIGAMAATWCHERKEADRCVDLTGKNMTDEITRLVDQFSQQNS